MLMHGCDHDFLGGRWCRQKKSHLRLLTHQPRAVVLKLFWFGEHCKTYNNIPVHFVYKIKNIFIYFKL
jgi:hypothetical protein